jgi:signal transduction histidine kinase
VQPRALLNRLPRKVLRLGLVSIAWIFFFASVALSIYSFKALQDTAHFRDNFITRKYEGSLSEDLGFVAALTTEASREFNFESKDEQRITDQISKGLTDLKYSVEALKPLPSNRRLGSHSPETASDQDELLQWMSNSAIRSLTVDDLNLRPYLDPEFPGRPALQTKAGRASSFVFIPAPLVTADGDRLDLAPALKRELVFSKIVESRLLDAIPQIASELGPKDYIYQAYFIPFSGFIRIIAAKVDDQVANYGGSFPLLKSFSDRTYFNMTKKAAHQFRRSEPYIDVTGGGLVVTYSVYVRNDSLGVVGLIGIDRRLPLPKSFWDRMRLGLGPSPNPLKDFKFGSSQQPSGGSQEPKGEEATLRKQIGANQRYFQQGIRRVPIDSTTAFTVPMGEDEVGYFLFDAGRIARKYKILAVLYAAALIVPAVLALLTFYFRHATVMSERMQEEIVRNLQSGFLVVDQQDRILTANEKFQEIVDDRSPKLQKLGKYLVPESLSDYHRQPEVSQGFPGSIRRSDGTISPVIITSAPLSFGGNESSRMLILIPSADLELKIVKKFLHVFAHALKTPAHSILLIADSFRRRKAYPKFDHYFSLMNGRVQEFSTLVDDVLRFSELDIKNVQPKRRPINIAQVLRKTLSTARERAEKKDLHFTSEIPESLNAPADAEMLQIVLNNLLDNALKYTDQGEVSVHAVDTGTQIRITFADTGPGVPKEERSRIFDLFFQSANRSEEKGGLGLGLYISKKYVELHGGELLYKPVLRDPQGVDESLGLQGSKFIIELPKRINPNEQEA